MAFLPGIDIGVGGMHDRSGGLADCEASEYANTAVFGEA